MNDPSPNNIEIVSCSDETQSQMDASTQLLVLEESDQDIFQTSECLLPTVGEKTVECEVMTITDSSQAEESQDDMPIVKTVNAESGKQTVVELIEVDNPTTGTIPDTITEQQDTMMESENIVVITDSSEDQAQDVEAPITKRKFVDDSGLCSLWKLQRSDEMPSTSKEISAVNVARSTTPVSNLLTKVRSSPRTAKRSNSCSLECCAVVAKPSPRTRRFASADEPSRAVSPLRSKKLTRDDLSINLKRFKLDSVVIDEEQVDNQNSSQNESQGFKLQLSPSGFSQDDSKGLEKSVAKLRHLTSSEPCAPFDKEVSPLPKVNQPHSLGYNYSDESGRNSQMKLKKIIIATEAHSAGVTNDQDSTVSVDSSIEDSNPLTSKMMAHLSNGYSSTPENVAANIPVLQQKLPTTNTPNSNNPQLDASKKQQLITSDTTTPSTISPLTNGHSSMPSNATSPSLPVFDIQIGYDDNGDFMSLVIVRTDIDSGVDMCKELQRVSKRFTMDPYFADVSKSSSPSSILSSIPPYNRTSFTSIASSSTSGSSSRTTDGAFIIPRPPKKSLSSQGPMTVKGYKQLTQRTNEILVQLAEVHGVEILNTSLHLDNKQPSTSTTPSNISGDALSVDSSNHRNGSATADEIGHRATPKSSLKKLRAKGRRPMTGKTKRAILPSTSEEEYIEPINSPEMVPTDIDKLKLSASPVYDDDYSNVTPVTPKSVSRLQGKKKQDSPSAARSKTPVQVPTTKKDDVTHCEGTVVLAKWVDKRYYSGRVVQLLDANKYMIQFDDGHTKPMLDDFIIFGNMKELPILGQSVYALIDEDQNFEPGLVMAVEENEHGTICYRCTTDRDMTVSIVASEMYLTDDQAKLIKESCQQKSPNSTPSTPRRRGNRELDLENIIQGPRSARLRDKPTPLSRKGKGVAASPEASTSGIKRNTPVIADSVRKQRQVSECSELSEGSTGGGVATGACGPPGRPRTDPRLEEVAGVEPEIQKTPRKIDGMKAGPLHLKGAAKQNPTKKSSKVMKLENDDTIALLGPIPAKDSTLFTGLCFLLTCTDPPKTKKQQKNFMGDDTYDSQSDSCTDREDFEFTSSRPFVKERIKEQIESGGGVVYSHFEDVPKKKYNTCKLIAPRPCLTAKYIQCLAVNVKAITHFWVIRCCLENKLMDYHEDELPSGWSIEKDYFVRWGTSVDGRGRRGSHPFKDKLILLCSDNDTFTLFWDRVCSTAGAETRIINEDNLNLSGGYAVITESDCSHQVQNKAVQDNIPLLSTTWVVQCLIEGRLCSPTGHHKYLFSYTESD